MTERRIGGEHHARDLSDSDRVPLDEHVHMMTNGERRDAQVRVLEALGAHLSDQMAELAMGQKESAQRSAAMSARVDGLERVLVANTDLISEVREILEYGKLGLRVIGWVSTVASWLGFAIKWTGGLAAAALAVWAFIDAATVGKPPGGK
jgi:hypothetical protein